MLLGYNMFGWYTSLSLRRWENADNRHIEMVFETNHVPAVHLLCETTASEASIKIYDAFTNEPVEPSYSMEVADYNIYKYLRFTGAINSGQAEGYYYAVIIIDGSPALYSDVFAWVTDVSELLKFTITGSDFALGDTYLMLMTGFTFEGYLYAEKAETDAEITEEGVEKPYGVVPVFNTRNIVNSFEIIGNRHIYKFLSGLRVLSINGTVLFTYKGIEMYAYDIVVEKKQSNDFDDSIIITLKFKEEDYISAVNAI